MPGTSGMTITAGPLPETWTILVVSFSVILRGKKSSRVSCASRLLVCIGLYLLDWWAKAPVPGRIFRRLVRLGLAFDRETAPPNSVSSDTFRAKSDNVRFHDFGATRRVRL